MFTILGYLAYIYPGVSGIRHKMINVGIICAGACPAGPAEAGPMFMVRRPSDMFKLLHSRISAYYRSVGY